MNHIENKTKRRMLPAALILFLLLAVTFPFALENSWAGRSDSPDHILTYTKDCLTWDTAAGVDESGAARLDLFDPSYPNADSGSGANIAAPGTGKQSVVRLKNDVSGPVAYKAVLYRIQDDAQMAVNAGLAGSLTDTAEYPLPDGVAREQVLRAVTGTVKGGEFQDFDINWLWEFEEGPKQDLADSAVGDRACLNQPTDVKLGLYIVVEDGNSYVTPESPQTGDNSAAGMYIALMIVSAVMLILLLLEKRRERECGR